MSSFTGELADVLGPAIEAARRALQVMEKDDVPAPLRRVAAASGGRLPPPLARALLEALDGDEWLRSEALEQLPDGSGSRVAASRAFLERPDGWWVGVAGAAVAAAGERLESERARLDKELEKTRSRLEVAKRKAKAQHGAAPAEKGTDLDELRGKLKATAATHRRRISELETKLDADRAALAQAVADRDEATALAHALRNRVLDLKREAGVQAERSGGPAIARDPVGLARLLDRMASMVAAPPPADEPQLAAAPRVTRPLPPGIAPDRPKAVRWLIERKEPFTLIVDGYNVLYLLDPHVWSSGGARRRLNESLGRLRRQAASVPRIVVVYDSQVGGEVPVSADGVEVRFAPEGSIADDEVVALAAAAAGDVYVVSTDRRVREESEVVGAVGLWSEAIVGYLSGRS